MVMSSSLSQPEGSEVPVTAPESSGDKFGKYLLIGSSIFADVSAAVLLIVQDSNLLLTVVCATVGLLAVCAIAFNYGKPLGKMAIVAVLALLAASFMLGISVGGRGQHGQALADPVDKSPTTTTGAAGEPSVPPSSTTPPPTTISSSIPFSGAPAEEVSVNTDVYLDLDSLRASLVPTRDTDITMGPDSGIVFGPQYLNLPAVLVATVGEGQATREGCDSSTNIRPGSIYPRDLGPHDSICVKTSQGKWVLLHSVDGEFSRSASATWKQYKFTVQRFD